MSQYSQLRRAGLPSIFVYDVPEDLPLVNVTAGTIAFIESISGLFIYNNGWRPLDTSEDGPIISAAPLSISVQSGTEYTTTIEASDPDELPVVYSVTTTGDIVENTEVNIDETTGVLTVLSNNPYNDNFSIILTVSDGVFATTRTIPVTITNRLPVFTVEPAESIVAGSGVEFSYQYTATDADDSTTLDFTVAQDLTTASPNFQHIQKISFRDGVLSSSRDQELFGVYSTTGGDYLVVAPDGTYRRPINVYKWSNADNSFKSFQRNITVNGEVGDSNLGGQAVAVSNDFLYISEDTTSGFSEKILKYDTNTEQFVEWIGGEIETDNISLNSAIFCKTSNGDTALIVGYVSGLSTDGCIKVFVYDDINDTWIKKLDDQGGELQTGLFYGGDLGVNTRGSTRYSSIVMTGLEVNPWKEHEFVSVAHSTGVAVDDFCTVFVWELTLSDDQGSVENNEYTLVPNIVAATDAGLGRFTVSEFSERFRGTSAFFEDRDTLWCSHTNGAIFKIERGDTLDDDNNSAWVDDHYDGGSAIITAYTTITGSYTGSLFIPDGPELNIDTLIVNGSVGSLGYHTFQLDNNTNTIQYISTLSNYGEYIHRSSFSDSYTGSELTGGYVVFNRNYNLAICGSRSTAPRHADIFGLGVEINIDSQGSVVGTPRSYGNYNITTSVSDSIDTISDTVALEVPIGINFTQVPPTSKTINASATQSFTADATTSNYNKTARIKVTSDIPHVYKTEIPNATSITVKGNELIVLVNDEVRVYTIDQLGEISSTYVVVNIDSELNEYSRITDVYSTDDYLILGRKGKGDTTDGSLNLVGSPFTVNIVWAYSRDGLGRIIGISYVSKNYRYIDLHQDDQSTTKFFNYSYTEYYTDPNSPNHSQFKISLNQYDPLTNEVNELFSNDISSEINVSENGRREYCNFFKTYHREWAGDAGTGVGYLVHENVGQNDAQVIKFLYDNDGINIVHSQEFNGSSGTNVGFASSSSADGLYFSTVYNSSTDAIVYLMAATEEFPGSQLTWTNNITGGSNKYYRNSGFIKIAGEYHLVTLLFNNSDSRYEISIWEIPTTSSELLSSVTTYTVDFTDADVTDLIGAIASDNNNNVIVGKWLFTVNILSKTLTKHSVMTEELTGINENLPQRVEYNEDTDAWYVFSSGAKSLGGGNSFGANLNGAFISAFRLHPITKSVTNISSIITGNSDTLVTTGVNKLGEHFTSSLNFDEPTTSNYPSTGRQGGSYLAGNVFGDGSLLIYNKNEGEYTYNGIITVDDTTSPLGNIVGGIQQLTDVAHDITSLVFGYPWYWLEGTGWGNIFSYTYNQDTASWDKVNSVHPTSTYETETDENFGYSLAKYNDFIIEAGPREFKDSGNNVRTNPIFIFGNRYGQILQDKTFTENLAKNVFAKSYIALGNGNSLTVWNSAYNVPSLTLQEAATVTPVSFTDRNDLTAPSGVNNTDWADHITGSDNLLVNANDNNIYIHNRGVNNKFTFERYFTDSGIKKIEAADNEADTVAVLSDSSVKIYSRDLSSYLRSATSISNGTITLYPKYLTSGTYTLSTMATDSINTDIKNTAITQNAVFDYSSVVDKDIAVEWGSADVQTLPVSDTFDTTWHYAFTDSTVATSQIDLSDNTTDYELTVTPSTVTHDKFILDLDLELADERETAATFTYNTYSSWKLGPTDYYDWDGGVGNGFRSLNPVLDGNEGADQSLYYGYSVSMSEIDIPNSTGYLAVGQPRSNWDDTGVSTTRGEVYVYQWNNSQGANELSFVGNAHQQRIQNSITFGTDTNADGQHFGWIVDITADGENLLVTAPGINTLSADETQSSSAQAGALVYARQSDGTFANPKQIDFSDISLSSSQLGTAAAISDDASTIVFGSANYPLDGNQYGLVSVWRRNNSTGEYSSFSVIDHITNNWAGASNTGKDVAVSADGSVIAIGQPGDGNAQSGKVLVYRYTAGGYQLVQSLTANFEGDDFGYSVDMTPDGGTIVVGSPGFVVSTQAEAGAVFIYDGNTTDGYTLTSSQLPSISTTGVVLGGRMGHSVTIDKFGSTIIAGAPYTVRTTRSSNNFEQGSVYTMYKESGSWSMYNKRYIPWQVKNTASYNGVNGVQYEWRNRTYGWSVCLAPNGSQLAVGDPTLGSEVTRSTTERVWTHQPSKVDLIHKVLDDNSSLFTSTSYNDYTGNLESQAVTMGTGSPLTVILPDFWPTGIASKSGYTYTILSNSGGISASTNVDGNLEISHTRNSATVAAGSTLILITPPPPIQNESKPSPAQSLGIVINWI